VKTSETDRRNIIPMKNRKERERERERKKEK